VIVTVDFSNHHDPITYEAISHWCREQSLADFPLGGCKPLCQHFSFASSANLEPNVVLGKLIGIFYTFLAVSLFVGNLISSAVFFG